MRNISLLSLTLLAWFATSVPGSAAPITGVTATASGVSVTSVGATVDGSNISSFSETATTIPFHNAFFGILPDTVTFNLNTTSLVDGFEFWNVDTNGNSAFGTKSANMFFSNDGGTTFNPVTGGVFTAGGAITFAEQTNPAPNPGVFIAFNPVVADQIRLTVNSTFNGANDPGFQAIIFDGSAVPAAPEVDGGSALPALVLLGSGLLILEDRSRRVPSAGA